MVFRSDTCIRLVVELLIAFKARSAPERPRVQAQGEITGIWAPDDDARCTHWARSS